MLLDSNIIIYAAQAEHATLRQFIADYTPAVSVISYIEALRYTVAWGTGADFAPKFLHEHIRVTA